MQTRYLYLLRFILVLSDLVLINFSFFFSYSIYNRYHVHTEISIYFNDFLISSLIWLLASGVFELYEKETFYKLETIYRATFRTIVLHIILFPTYTYVIRSADFPIKFMFFFFSILIFCFILSRFLGTALEGLLSRNFNIRKSVAVLGMNEGGLKLAAYLEKQNSFNFIGFLGDEGFHVDSHGTLLPGAAIQLQTAANSGIQEVFVSLTPDRMSDVGYLLQEAEKQCIRLKFVPDLSSTSSVPFNIEHMGGFSILSVRKEPLEDMRSRFKKRVFDIMFSSLVIVFILSWLYPIIALLIKLDSNGPVIFKQKRSGRNNLPFWCYKFRSMRLNTEVNKQASRNDDRITKIGRFMRRTSIDELPQFFNVFLGNMSVVGPRPHMLDHTEEYKAIIDQYMVRQFLKPGITGWAQVKGFRGETKQKQLMEKRVEHDIWYMEHWSSMLDVQIVFMTIINILKGEENAF